MCKMRLILLFSIVIVFISSLPGVQAEDVAEVTKSLSKEAGLVGLDGPLDQLDLTKMLAESFEPEEQEGSEETSPSGDAVEEAEPVEKSIEEAGETEHVLSQEESETESDAEAEPAEQEPEWLQRRIDRFTRKRSPRTWKTGYWIIQKPSKKSCGIKACLVRSKL